MILRTTRIESYFHLDPEQHIPQHQCALVEEDRSSVHKHIPKAHTLLIFRCIVEELWFYL